MTNYFKAGKGTVANYIGIDGWPSFTSSLTALTSGNVNDIDSPDGEVIFTEPKAVKQTYGIDTANPHAVVVKSYTTGEIAIPEHNVVSGKWLRYTIGSATTVGASHTITETATPANFSVHGEMEHLTSGLNHRRDALGCFVRDHTYSFSQTEPTKQALNIGYAQGGSGNNIARLTTLDYKKAFLAGQHSHTLLYNATSLGITTLGGTWNIKNTWKEIKGGSKYITEVILLRREYTINLDVMLYNSNIFAVPEDPNDYSGALTYSGKLWASKTSSWIYCSMNNVRLEERAYLKKISDADYLYNGKITIKRTGLSTGTAQFQVADALSSTHY